ncbi:MAG: MmgE/PrpD family protein [Bosea sp. (in: a-proteobacteria)]
MQAKPNGQPDKTSVAAMMRRAIRERRDMASLARATDRDAARAALMDTLGCILAGARHETVRKLVAGRSQWPCMASILIGQSSCGTPEEAALINGTAAHVLDFDDNFLPAITHASAVLFPALFAVAPENGVSGAGLLEAYLFGLEMQALLGDVMNPGHYALGWHATSTIGTVGAAAAAAYAADFDGEGIWAAMGAACSLASGSKVQFGSEMKPVHAGLAARNGVLAMRLANQGIGVSDDVFDGAWGFPAMFSGHGSSSMTKAMLRLEGPIAIAADGLAAKRFPCCGSAHRTMDGILQLMQQHGIATAEIEAIETVVPASNAANLRFPAPQTPNEARFSMHYCAALVACLGEARLTDFTPEALTQPDVLAMMQRITMTAHVDPEPEGSGIWDQPAITRIFARGLRYEAEVFQPVGSLHAPLSPAQAEAKFRDCASAVWNTQRIDAALQTVADFDTSAPAERSLANFA